MTLKAATRDTEQTRSESFKKFAKKNTREHGTRTITDTLKKRDAKEE